MSSRLCLAVIFCLYQLGASIKISATHSFANCSKRAKSRDIPSEVAEALTPRHKSLTCDDEEMRCSSMGQRVCNNESFNGACTPQIISKVWETIPASLRVEPTEIADQFFNHNTFLVAIGDSTSAQQVFMFRRIFLAALGTPANMNRNLVWSKRGKNLVFPFANFWATKVEDVFDYDLDVILNDAPADVQMDRMVVFVSVGMWYNNMTEFTDAVIRLNAWAAQVKRAPRARPLEVQVLVREPPPQHFDSGDYKKGDECLTKCTPNGAPNERKKTFDNAVSSSDRAFDVLSIYNVTEPLFFAHAAPCRSCSDSQCSPRGFETNDCTHYCKIVPYVWNAVLGQTFARA